MNTAIKLMLKRPGIYNVSTLSSPHLYSRVEVDLLGRAHQLTPQLKRDGILSTDKWVDDATATYVGVADRVS